MDYKELKLKTDKQQVEIDTFHLFYNNFNKYDLAISNGNGILSEMLSNVIGIKKKGNVTEKVLKQEQMIYDLMDVLNLLQGLNNQCQNQKLSLRFKTQRCFNLEHELEDIKKAHNES